MRTLLQPILVSLVLLITFQTTTFAQAKVLFFGDSITAGLGVGPEKAYTAIVQQLADSAGKNIEVVNAGLSGETSAGGLRRINWILRSPIDVFVLELGGNDGLRGIATKDTEKNLNAILEKVHSKYPDAQLIVAGMQVPPNLGEKYGLSFKGLFKSVAEKNDALFIPFILEGVGGDPKLNQADGIHPTVKGHKIIGRNVWAFLNEHLDWTKIN